MTATERGRGGWGELGIQRAGGASETGFTNACSIVGAGGEIARSISRISPEIDSHPAPEDFAPADPKIFLQHKMPGPPEAPAPCVFQISPIARYVFWPNPRSRANSLLRALWVSETVRLTAFPGRHRSIGTWNLA